MDRGSYVRALVSDGPTVEQRGRETDPTLASLARLFNLAAIRPDKSRGPGTSGGFLVGQNPSVRQWRPRTAEIG